jgi:transcriptional regulator of arginine metabolism
VSETRDRLRVATDGRIRNPRPVDKERRQRVLTGLLQEHDITSQAQALELLTEYGIETTQATVSRDLDDLGAVKVRGPDGTLAYRLGSERTGEALPTTGTDRLREVLRQFVVSVDVSGNLVVVRTPPAGAGPVASAIDLAPTPGALATIAGDDTVLVVAEEQVPATLLAERLRHLAGTS